MLFIIGCIINIIIFAYIIKWKQPKTFFDALVVCGWCIVALVVEVFVCGIALVGLFMILLSYGSFV